MCIRLNVPPSPISSRFLQRTRIKLNKEMPFITEPVRNVLAELKSGLEGLYRQRLRGLYLYGSYARGEQERESDVDLLIVLDQIGAYGAEIDHTSELISSLSLRHGISVSRVFVTQEAWRESRGGFLSRVRREAIAA